VQVHLDVLLRDHELHVDSFDSRECASIKQLLRSEANAHLELQALQVHIGVALGLHEALLQLEMATVEGSGEVVSLENDGVVGDIVVEIHKFIVLLQVERVLDQVPLVPLQLNVWDLDVVNEANDLSEDFVFGLAERAQVDGGVDACVRACCTFGPSQRRPRLCCGKYCCYSYKQS